jgi:nucleotide-binding universal stress UspA family protein
MKKIMVTTDLSVNSKSAIRMAIRLAKLGNASLSVLNVCHIPKPFGWTQIAYEKFVKKSMDKLTAELSAFVSRICRSMGLEPIKFRAVVINSLLVVSTINDYAEGEKFDCILIGTRGAGLLKKLFGTNTSDLMSISKIPIISIPSKYRCRKIKAIVYSTDMEDFEKELPRIMDFATFLRTEIQMLSITLPFERINNPEQIQMHITKEFKSPIKFIQANRNIENSLIEDIYLSIKLRPNVILALFSHHRSGFEKLFFPSNAERYSFFANVPILAMSKGI